MDDGCLFEIFVIFIFKLEVKLVNGVLDLFNFILVNIYKSCNWCVVVVDYMVDEFYGKLLINYFE